MKIQMTHTVAKRRLRRPKKTNEATTWITLRATELIIQARNIRLTVLASWQKNEIANEAASILYRLITAVLSKSRNFSKTQIFHDFTYLFVGWSHNSCQVDQKYLKINRKVPMSGKIDYIECLARKAEIRKNKQRAIERREWDRIVWKDITHVASLIAKRPVLSIKIEQNVIVNDAGTQLCFHMSLIKVLCRYLASYASLDSAPKSNTALSGITKNTLKVIVVLAIDLNKLFGRTNSW